MATSWPPDIPVFYAGTDAVAGLNLMSQSLAALLNPPVFRAERSTAFAVVENTHQYIPWSTPLEDTYGGWTSGNPTVYTAPASGWYHVQAAVSLSGTGAAGLVLIPALSINGTSPTGASAAGQEGEEAFVPTGTNPKIVRGTWWAYANAGDPIQIDLWYSTESGITAVDTTAGIRCRVGIVGIGI